MSYFSGWLKAVLRDARGTMVVPVALAIPVIVGVTGAVADFSLMQTGRSEVQAALDAAVLSAFNSSTTPSQARAQSFFASRTFKSGVVVGAPQFTLGTNRIAGTVSFTYQTKVLSLASISSVNMTVSATAEATRENGISTITAKIVSASGAYDKEIYFFTTDKAGNIASKTLLLDYNYAAPNKYYTPSIGSSMTSTVPSYESYGFYMVIYEDTTYTGKHVSPKTLSSTDTNVATFRKSSGACTDGTGQTDNWEDGGDSNFKDFVVNLTCTTGPNGPIKVKLVN